MVITVDTSCLIECFDPEMAFRWWSILSMLAGVALSGCVAHCPKSDVPDRAFCTVSHSPGFNEEEIDGYRVYRVNETASRKAPPVLVLHELPALSARTLDFASRLGAQGFVVYVPRLFGNTEGHTGLMATTGTVFEVACSPKWTLLLAENKTSPELRSIRQLCRTISTRHHRQIGVIGMCLTGAFPVALMSDHSIAAAGVCQPSTPMLALTAGAKRSLGLAPADIQSAVAAARKRHLEIFFTRYQSDKISHIERTETLATLFQGHFRDRTIGGKYSPPFDIPKRSHATMTNCAHTPPGRWVFQELTKYLHEKLD